VKDFSSWVLHQAKQELRNRGELLRSLNHAPFAQTYLTIHNQDSEALP
jgi:hypothetical protein